MLDYQALSALTAIIRTGSFEKAARQLGVTRSAVSQRIRQLEERMGTVLIKRGQPCTATEAGHRLVQHVGEVELLERAVQGDLGEPAPLAQATTVRIAVNADSLATWFVAALAEVDGLLFDLVVDDQDYSADWLAKGEVVAAVSSQAKPVQGCDCRPLGALRYVATASQGFIDKWFADGVTTQALERAPSMVFNVKDRLQDNWAQSAVGAEPVLPSHFLPSTQAFIDAAQAGLGWGMNPEVLVQPLITDGCLAELVPGHPLDVPLYWHCSRLAAPALSDLNKAVREIAHAKLEPLEDQLD
ncbi:MAG: LysR family transcriptional regulator ArgP [Alphaproteobacteria bacterium]|nr:LysR family transcriptional regulator ArgP [Alphaproteobacteria bacterium SS10]